jgi:hypothetical protein
MTMSHDHAETTPDTRLVRVQAVPAAAPDSVLCKAVEIGGAAREGAPVTLTERGDPFPVAVAGAEPPGPGEYVVAEQVGGSWAIEPRGRGA